MVFNLVHHPSPEHAMRRSPFLLLSLILLCATAMLAAQSSDAKPQAKKKKDDKKQAAVATTSGKKPKAESKPERKLTERERALHALNRLTFGPRPGDVDHVLSIGVDQ